MKQTNINIDEIKRFPTVTNPIKADDLNTCKVYQYSPARCIVTDYTAEQRADLLEMTKGREIADGIVFASSKYVLGRLHSWQNHEAQKQRAAILGDGWQWINGLNHGTEPGDLITCLDGTRGRVTKSDPESCCIEFETKDGHRLTVAGYFRYTPSAKLRNSESKESDAFNLPSRDEIRPSAKSEMDGEQAFNEAMTINVGDRVTSKHYHQTGTVTAIRTEKGKARYDVKFDKPVESFWSDEMREMGDFCRYAITKDFDPATGCEREGTAIYYAEELQADYWQSEPRTIFDIEIYKPTARRPSWLVVADIFSDPKEMTLREVCGMLAARYQEHHKAA